MGFISRIPKFFHAQFHEENDEKKSQMSLFLSSNLSIFAEKRTGSPDPGSRGGRKRETYLPSFLVTRKGFRRRHGLSFFFLKRIFTVRNIIAGNGCLLDDIRIQDIRIRYKAEFNYFQINPGNQNPVRNYNIK